MSFAIEPDAHRNAAMARRTIPLAVQRIEQDQKKSLVSQLIQTLPPPSKPGQGTQLDRQA